MFEEIILILCDFQQIVDHGITLLEIRNRSN